MANILLAHKTKGAILIALAALRNADWPNVHRKNPLRKCYDPGRQRPNVLGADNRSDALSMRLLQLKLQLDTDGVSLVGGDIITNPAVLLRAL
jgi:hypothetical protein